MNEVRREICKWCYMAMSQLYHKKGKKLVAVGWYCKYCREGYIKEKKDIMYPKGTIEMILPKSNQEKS